MKRKNIIMLIINSLIITSVFILNYFYQSNGFSFKLKIICSGLFATLGIINLIYAILTKTKNVRFYISMSIALILACLGDYFINKDFIAGAGLFALGHIGFIIAYCFTQKIKLLDCIISFVVFLGSLMFLLFCPLLTFNVELFRIVCIIYALIISTMLGKAFGNFIRKKNYVNLTIAIASLMFFLSDLMLVLAWFIKGIPWADNVCMGLYYPALCFLALSMFLQILLTKDNS